MHEVGQFVRSCYIGFLELEKALVQCRRDL